MLDKKSIKKSVEVSLKIIYGFNMPTKKDILNFAVDKNLLERLDDFRFENRINSRSEAIRRLLKEALKKYPKKRKV